MTDDLYSNVTDDGQIRSDTNEAADGAMTMIDPATIGIEQDDKNDKDNKLEGDDDTPKANAEASIQQADTIDVSIGKRKIPNVRRAAIHKLAFRDMETMGKTAMIKAD
jgi:hypothetical protein